MPRKEMKSNKKTKNTTVLKSPMNISKDGEIKSNYFRNLKNALKRDRIFEKKRKNIVYTDDSDVEFLGKKSKKQKIYECIDLEDSENIAEMNKQLTQDHVFQTNEKETKIKENKNNEKIVEKEKQTSFKSPKTPVCKNIAKTHVTPHYKTSEDKTDIKDFVTLKHIGGPMSEASPSK